MILDSDKSLEFGYQNRSTIFSGKETSGSLGGTSKSKWSAQSTGKSAAPDDTALSVSSTALDVFAGGAVIGDGMDRVSTPIPAESASPTEARSRSATAPPQPAVATASKEMDKKDSVPEAASAALSLIVDTDALTDNGLEPGIDRRALLVTTGASIESSLREIEEAAVSEDLGDGVDLSKVYAKSSIILLDQQLLEYHSSEVFKHCWLPAEGYG